MTSLLVLNRTLTSFAFQINLHWPPLQLDTITLNNWNWENIILSSLFMWTFHFTLHLKNYKILSSTFNLWCRFIYLFIYYYYFYSFCLFVFTCLQVYLFIYDTCLQVATPKSQQIHRILISQQFEMPVHNCSNLDNWLTFGLL